MNLFRARSRDLLFLIVILILASFSKPEQPDPNFHLYLLVGQSNMAGRGTLTAEYRNLSQPNVMMLNKDGKWVEASHPLHFDKPARAGAGPGLMFGLEMAKANPSVRIGLIPCAVGGTAIESWEPGAMDSVTRKYPYDDAIARLRLAMKSGVIKGIIWHQGEANSRPERAAGYLEKLETLIGRLRENAQDKNLPFVAGELGRYRDTYQLVNDQLRLLPEKVKRTALASSEGLVHKGDKTHFDAASATELGKRFATQMIHLQQNK
ncbi:MAG TPA: sialate O-acetylesterase [Pedobacter sp.]|uniref:sialate O-acetylesterase n=1 Tax=Pedobacter sp. TaxID=1411316 RepID=UPI002C53540B|nr:sialate O-acetylesterase [Pedobacter sp.]HMI05642.1 sialate O-acetylesterase [Pedobacter sp.]